MKQRFLLFFTALFLSLIIVTAGSAQVFTACGTENQHLIIERLQKNRAEFLNRPLARTQMPTYVPVIYHLVGDNSGNERANLKDVLEMHCFLNNFYDTLDMRFYITDLNYIDNSTIHTDPRSANSRVRIRLAKRNNAMNIFLVKNIGGGAQGGSTLGYYVPGDDYIVIQENQINGFASTLAHEVGHFFSLAHTFYGWENTVYDASQPTPTFVTLSNGQRIMVEYVNRNRNCNNSADGFCDTPPDYLLGFQNPAGGCNPYNGPAKDPDNVPVDPMENNLMSYFERCPVYRVTQEQTQAMQQDLQSTARSALRTGWTPPSISVDDDIRYRTPNNNASLPVYVNIDLDWDDVPGATHYLVEIDRINTFNRDVLSFVVDESFLTVPELRQNFNYYWRVTPYNPYYTCATGQFQRFRTGDQVTSVNNITGLDYWAVVPNPLTSGPATIKVDNTEAIEGTMSVIDLQGKILWQNTLQLTPGTHNIPVEFSGTNAGIYFVRLESNRGVSTRKIIIQE